MRTQRKKKSNHNNGRNPKHHKAKRNKEEHDGEIMKCTNKYLKQENKEKEWQSGRGKLKEGKDRQEPKEENDVSKN